jgi:hypothetical protein
MNTKTPPIVQLGAWLLSLFVFAVGFWHTHLGLKEMKPFNSELGGLVVAGIVLLLLLITYWFAVNGKSIALVFYILCGCVFFVCNLNYFYPSYMARTLIKEEAAAIKDTINNYGSVNPLKSEVYEEYLRLMDLRNDIVKQIRENGGQGVIALSQLKKFNQVAGSEITQFNTQILSESQISTLERQMDDAIDQFKLKKSGLGITKIMYVLDGWEVLDSLRTYVVPQLEEIAADDSPILLDSIKTHPHVQLIDKTVQKLNSAVISYNKGSDTTLLKELHKDHHPRAKQLGRIQNTFITIGERVDQISTWAIILLCLFIDLIVPLALYLLLRKKEDSLQNKVLLGGPTNF